jgi:hypothetical protein
VKSVISDSNDQKVETKHEFIDFALKKSLEMEAFRSLVYKCYEEFMKYCTNFLSEKVVEFYYLYLSTRKDLIVTDISFDPETGKEKYFQTCPGEGILFSTFYNHGHWIKNPDETKTGNIFSKKIFEDADIHIPGFDLVKREFKKKNISIKDVTDKKVSKNIQLKISFFKTPSDRELEKIEDNLGRELETSDEKQKKIDDSEDRVSSKVVISNRFSGLEIDE